MILEYAQILSTANRIYGMNEGYQMAHINHPSVIWARESYSNWLLLYNLAGYLHEEYKYRYGKIHKAYTIIQTLHKPPIPDIGVTKPYLAMPEYCKVEDTVQSYRNYYINEKQHIASWKGRPVPEWFIFK